jgi:hypothetical protein
MADSIMQTRKECFYTKSTEGLHKHHIFQASRRKASEKWGCWVWLRYDWHNGAPYGVHNNPSLARELRQLCQMRFEELYGRETFMRVFGKNFLEE